MWRRRMILDEQFVEQFSAIEGCFQLLKARINPAVCSSFMRRRRKAVAGTLVGEEDGRRRAEERRGWMARKRKKKWNVMKKNITFRPKGFF
jgi:hypothetical protein